MQKRQKLDWLKNGLIYIEELVSNKPKLSGYLETGRQDRKKMPTRQWEKGGENTYNKHII